MNSCSAKKARGHKRRADGQTVETQAADATAPSGEAAPASAAAPATETRPDPLIPIKAMSPEERIALFRLKPRRRGAPQRVLRASTRYGDTEEPARTLRLSRREQPLEHFGVDIAAGQHRDHGLALHVELACEQRRRPIAPPGSTTSFTSRNA